MKNSLLIYLLDECATGNHDCDYNAICSNEVMGYKCECKIGYSGDGFKCNDVDECAANNDCHENATCRNTDGSFACECDEGYNGDGINCNDINECEADSVCSEFSDCLNHPGGYSCLCKAGFVGKDNKVTRNKIKRKMQKSV